MTEALWVDLFAQKMSMLGVRAEPQQIVEMAREMFQKCGAENPVDVAQAAFEAWPPHDD